MLELWVERVIRDGLLQKKEWFEMEIDHLMRKLRLSTIFPKKGVLWKDDPVQKRHRDDLPASPEALRPST